MLSEIERMFPTNCNTVQVDIDNLISVRKDRNKLFNNQYFSNKSWDIILILYCHEINGLPIDANGISRKLDMNFRSVLRYLNLLLADDIICAYDKLIEDRFNVAHDYLSLTRTGFENTGFIVQQTRSVFAQTA